MSGNTGKRFAGFVIASVFPGMQAGKGSEFDGHRRVGLRLKMQQTTACGGVLPELDAHTDTHALTDKD
jgi:hypothetical protein